MPAAPATGAARARRRFGRAAATALILAAVLVAPVACSASGSSGEVAVPTTARVVAGRRPLPGFGQTAARVTTSAGRVVELCLLVAATEALRDRGLMGVTDRSLGGYDGMLFTFTQPTVTEFWMRNTPQPLSVAFLDGHGRYVSSTDMAPCGDRADCPTYASRGPYTDALEVPRGRLPASGVAAGATLRRTSGACPTSR